MKLSQFKNKFTADLKEDYPLSEVDSFFFRLAEFHLEFKRVDVALNPEFALSEKDHVKLINAQNRLKQGEPIQYILGSTQFYGLDVLVNPSVLIPRPETEELVEWIIQDHQAQKNQNISILDVGTGSGCIAIALAKNLPQAQITAIDISAKALKTASKNADLNQVDINFEQQDILSAVTLSRKHDIIVSNPPYVRELEKKQMHKNVLYHEPETALFVKDEDALIFYREISKMACAHLNPGGRLYFEINQYLAEETRDLVIKNGFKEVEVRNDLFKNPRMLRAVKSR